MLFWTIVVVIWIVCGIFAYGADYSYFQREFPTGMDGDHRLGAIFMGFLGPIGLLIEWKYYKFKHGLRFR